MIILSTDKPEDARRSEWWYNSLDAAATLEIHNKLSEKNKGGLTYAHERLMQGPALDMMLRGFRIDPVWRSRLMGDLQRELDMAETYLNELAEAVWDQPLIPLS